MRVFVSYAQEDAQRIAPVCQALAAWQLTYSAPTHDAMNPEQNTSIQQSLTQSDIFLRMCTAYTPQSYWMTFEQTAFLAVQAEEYRQSGKVARKLINVILDKQYQRLPFDYADPMVDATQTRDTDWQNALYAAIFAPPV
jgi:predicted transcriptional regulator